MGILFSFGALVAWGIGDFLIQRSARRFGDWVALFYITAFGTIALLPFVYKDLKPLLWNEHGLILLLVASCVMTLASYFNFEALRIGKISVVEPIYAFEIAVTAGFSSVFAREYLTPTQGILIGVVVLGIILVSTKSFLHIKKIKWETGTLYAIIAMIGMGATNFLYGIGARDTNPLLINWFTNLFIMLVCFFILAKRDQLKNIPSHIKNNGRLILAVGFIDNLAWVFFCYAVLYIPIAIATGISEGYIALGVLLGLSLNKEQLRWHQKVGLVFSILATILLAFVTKR